MTTPTYSEWVANWGEERLAERIANTQKSGLRQWQERNKPNVLRASPAWEIYLGSHWQESLEEWHSRWRRCGGRLSEGRMIAAKWDSIWERLSSTFYDGLGYPYPPYARSSCAYWLEIGQDEAIVVGAISESEFCDYMAQFPRVPLKDNDGNPIPTEVLQAALQELREQIYRDGGPRPDATNAERRAFRVQRHRESVARAIESYKQQSEKRNRDRDRDREDKDAVFRLLEQVEASLRDSPSVQDARRWEWFCTSLTTLTSTVYFEHYPNWQARAWIASAELHRLASDSMNELLCLERALTLNDKLPIKRRIKKLRDQH